jgi:hypothetical protein
MPVAKVLKSRRTACTVTRRSKSTRHHWPVPNAVIANVELLLSLASDATCVVSVLDCVAVQALPAQDRAKFSWYTVS